MIEEPTCLILGAGASAPYGLPTNAQLRDLILTLRSPTGAATADKFRLNMPHQNWLDPGNPAKEWNLYLNQVAEAAGLKYLLNDFFPKFFGADRSIDWFLRRHESTFGDIARLQIAAALLACERPDKLSSDWYQLLSEQVLPRNLNSLEKGKLSVISFNYDRSFERYFLNQFENLCGLSEQDAKDALERIDLEHVYGQLGTLEEVAYGDFTKAAEAAKGIHTIRLQPDQDMQARVGKMIQDATYINFIGFGFDDDNIDLLGPENFKGKRVFSSTKGMTARIREKIRKRLWVRFNPKDPPELNAAQLLNAKNLFGPKLPPPTPKRPSSANRPLGMRRRWPIGWDL